MDFQRILLSLIFFFSLFLLWEQWQRDQHPERYVQQASVATSGASGVAAASAPAAASDVQNASGAQVPADAEATGGRKITVQTDLLNVEINTLGGTLQRLELLKHHAVDSDKPFVLMQHKDNHIYQAQSGLMGKGMPDHNALFTATTDHVELAEGKDSVRLDLTYTTDSGVKVVKSYTFHRNSYLIDVGYEIQNNSKTPLAVSPYFQLKRDDSTPEGESRFAPAYLGPALYNEEAKYQKVQFSDVEKKKDDKDWFGSKYAKFTDNGWVAMLQHYFVAAWLPKQGEKRENFVRALGKNQYAAGVVLTVPDIEPGKTATTGVALYAGPANNKLDTIAPGLSLTVDYGWLTVIAKPMFTGLSYIQSLVQNWGVAIILLTLLIKIVFFPLSAASYRSMARMRLVAPKLQKIKEQYADDRERLHKAMMELYKTEKINPMGGCLPMMVQIPIFMALYWSILYSVEMRHAPFVAWITDLSAPDPYYILPAVMAASMLVQTRLNPAPPDPMQAKIMQTMPFIFGFVFFFFPAGLVLYSVVNNLLSILQQWVITRNAEKGTKPA